MALRLSTRISDRAWGDVDKTALGNKLATMYAAGDATRGNIKQIYLYVPDEAFDKDADGNPRFLASKAKMPVAEVSGSEIVINRNGVHAAAGALSGARSEPDMPAAAKAAAKRRLRGLYRRLKETPPDTLKESIAQLDRGKELTELVKGSIEYTQDAMRTAFDAQFQEPSPWTPGQSWCPYSIVDTFADHVVARAYGSAGEDLMPDEFYKVSYSKDGDQYTFDGYDQWQVVELTYQPQTMAESTNPHPNPLPGREREQRKRFVEMLDAAQVEFVEAGQAENPDGPWRIKAIGNTANVVNGNGRRYPAAILKAAVAELQNHLHESASQGMIRVKPTGESDHPNDKGNRRALLSETIINWDSVAFNGQHILLEGNLLGTAKGKDFRAQVKGGLKPGMSQRGYGDSRIVQENGQTIEEVTELVITGFDPTLPGDQSDVDSGVQFVESTQQSNQQQENEEMDLEKLKAMLKEHPELFEGLVSGKTLEERLEALTKMQAEQLKALDESIRKALGIDEKADVGAALKEAAEARKELAESKRKTAIETAIGEATKDLPYGKDMNALFVESIRAANPQDDAAVKSLVESKRKEYDKIAAQNKLFDMGFRGGVQSTAPVLERELGIPEYARGMHEITERLVKSGVGVRHDWRKPATRNEEFAVKMLERFDTVFGNKLKTEAKLLEEAEQTSDLNLPYSVSRAIVAQVVPQLVAVSVFDVDTIDQSPFYIFYESYTGETGATGTVTDEAVTADHDTWVALDYQRLDTGTVVVTSSPAGTTYELGTDYVIDHANGRLMALSTGAITDAQALLVDYTYTAIRKGEMAVIERGKATLSYKSMEAKADRLADQVSQEAIVFGRSQLGWDAVARTMAMLINEIRRKIDEGIFYLALNAALSVANNSGGTWVSTGNPPDYGDLVAKVGVAKVKVINRYYDPNQIRIAMSTGMSDTAGNWDGFTAAGTRPDSDLRATGFVGRLKGAPVFETTELPDTHVLVAHRELVAHLVFLPIRIDGPHKSRDATTGKLISADEYFAEEFNATDTPLLDKGSYVVVS